MKLNLTKLLWLLPYKETETTDAGWYAKEGQTTAPASPYSFELQGEE